MLDNYEITSSRIIKQIDKVPFLYGYDYSNTYNKLEELGMYMSYLRLGYIVGSIGHIPSSILDVGYGNGTFLKVASNIVPSCYGNDVTKEYTIPENCSFVDDIYAQKFEVVCFFDVLEHFENIYDIRELKADYVVISLPHCHNFTDAWFESWKHRKPNEHLWHFNAESLTSFMKELNYTVVNLTNIEDIIRKNNKDYSNILTGVFKKSDL